MANDLDTLTKDLYLQRSRSGTALRGSLSKSDSQISGSAGALIRLVGVGMMVAPPSGATSYVFARDPDGVLLRGYPGPGMATTCPTRPFIGVQSVPVAGPCSCWSPQQAKQEQSE